MADRILTTHVGSLPRPKDVSDMLFAREAGQPVDDSTFRGAVSAAVHDADAFTLPEPRARRTLSPSSGFLDTGVTDRASCRGDLEA